MYALRVPVRLDNPTSARIPQTNEKILSKDRKEERMQENVQKEEGGVSLLEILRLLLSKIKILILVVLVAGLAGGSFALYTSWNDLHFGTSVEFYVNPEKPKATNGNNASQFGVYGAYGRHVMDNMVKLLESESFTEQLLLDGKILPKLKFVAGETTPLGEVLESGTSWAWVKEPSQEERDAAPQDKVWAYDELENALKEAEIARGLANQNVGKLEQYTLSLTDLTKTFNSMSLLMADEWLALHLNNKLANASFNQEEYDDKVATLTETSPEYNDFKKLISLYDKMTATEAQIESVQADIKDLNEVFFQRADDLEKVALDLWRATPGYKSVLKNYSKAVSYSYLEANADIDDANNLARSFIYVKIAVVGEQNQPFAEEVHRRVKDIVPEFVKNNMTVPTDYEGTNCERITRTDEIHRTNPNHRTTQVIKYGLLFGAAALVIAAVVIIIVDKSDKRLRDTEVITKKFNVPILGIVPSIDELNEESHARKVAATKAPKNTNQEAK